jgi:hypothetical protein
MQCIVTYATGICSYLKSVMRYKVLILDTYHPDTLHLCEQGCEDLWLFFKTKRGLQAKNFGKHCSNGIIPRFAKTGQVLQMLNWRYKHRQQGQVYLFPSL